MQQQCSHDVRFFPVVGSVVADGRTINILCAGDYAQAKKRLFQYAQSIPVNCATEQGGKITNGAASMSNVAAGTGAFCAVGGAAVAVGVSA